MPNRIISTLITLSLLLTASGAVLANETSSGYDAVTFDDSITFSASMQSDGSVQTSWSKYNHVEDFTFYKVVRSETNESPVYPDDSYIYYTENTDTLSYTDETLAPGTYYYRVCQIASPKRYCSSTVTKIVIGENSGTATVEPPVTPEQLNEPSSPAQPELYTEPVAEVVTTRFSDLPNDHWAYQCVESLAEASIVDAQTKTQFFPNNPINRAEILKLVMQTYYPESSSAAGTNCFSDVYGGEWFAPYVCAAKTQLIISGYSDNSYSPSRSFGPARAITRAEGAALLVKALHIPLLSVTTSRFGDVTISWQKQAVETAYQSDLVNGYQSGYFGPNNNLSRAEAAKLICNAREVFTQPLEGPTAEFGTDETAPATPTTPVETTPTPPTTISGSIHNPAPLIINHSTANLNNVPQSAIDTAKSAFRIAYGHTSHGSQLTSGMEVLKGQNSLYDFSSTGGPGKLFYNEDLIWGDLGGDWEIQTRALLNDNDNNINMVMWSWCGQMSDLSTDDVNAYLSAMNKLEEDFPNVIFVYMTGHLDGSGETGTLHRNNEIVRAYARQYNKVLYDFADIESYDPSGAYFLNRAADDGNNYNSGNWSTEWCSANSASPLCQSVSCAHSQSLNCNLKGRAFWYMMARLGGWGG